jgi:two-component system, LytTR family, sensor kinase
VIFVVGIGTTHLFRSLVHHWNWAKLIVPRLIPRMLISAIVMSVVFTTFNTMVTDVFSGQIPLVSSLRTLFFWQLVLNFSALFLLWEIIYFSVHVFENWKREEILNLELMASKSEIELNSLKSQMNPHFMFNSMNSIRALVDEDPEKAKHAITMLSSILRSNLTLGRRALISMREEIDLVDKYLSLEKIRFEERLNVFLEIDPNSLSFEIPPFMLQTIVENGIKHGISKRVEGGHLKLIVRLENENMLVTVINSGKFNPEQNNEGIGLSNSRKRLSLIYKDKASLQIKSENDEVIVSVTIPVKTTQI